MKTIILPAAVCISLLFLPSMVSAYPDRDTLKQEIDQLEAELDQAQSAEGPLCLPESLAAAQSHLARAMEEFEEGDYWEAEDHILLCRKEAEGLRRSILACRQDLDRDGIPDRKDQCQQQPELYNGYRDDDGCPDRIPERAMLTREKIEILEPVIFDGDTQELLSSSLPVLESVARILMENPYISLRLEVHYDDSIPSELAERLTEIRAMNLKEALVTLGIVSGRLRAAGMGSREPIASNLAPLGRKLNKRVEFMRDS